MADYITALRKAQRDVADEISKRLLQTMLADFESVLQEAALKACIDASELDRDAARSFLEDEHARDVFVAVLGYSTWLATSLYRLHLATKAPLKDWEPMPDCLDKDIEAIAGKFSVEKSTLLDTIQLIKST